MKFHFRKKASQQSTSRSPGSRQVVRGGRAPAYAYRANRNDQAYPTGRGVPRDTEVSARRRERLVRYWRQRLGMFIAGLALVVCVLYTLHLNGQPKVISLAASSNSYFLQPTATYEAAASQAFTSSFFNNNKITVNSVALEQRLQKQFPELAQVSVTIPLMSHRPIIYIAPTTPSLILTNASGSFVLDNNGKALLSTQQVSDASKLKLPTLTDQSSITLKSGAIVLASSEVSFIQTVTAELAAKGVALDSLTLPTSAYELDVRPKGVGYFVKFNMHQDSARQQAGTFLATRMRLSSQGITPASYIDVRLDGRAYYQ